MTKAEIQQVKLRFGIIGNNEALMRAIDIAIQVAPTDLSVLITGESGVGKESFPQIIHQYSRRKHGQYIAVNCGAIPEGTIRNFSVTRKALLPVLSVNGKGTLEKRTAERFSLMR
jgi:DNA-binding NtrC family response regulator